MTQEQIIRHIENKEIEKDNILVTLEYVKELHKEVGLSEEALKDIQTKSSSKIAQIDISIRDHKKLLTNGG